jgi:hypothetical protein
VQVSVTVGVSVAVAVDVSVGVIVSVLVNVVVEVGVFVKVTVGVSVGVLVMQETVSVTALVSSVCEGEPITMAACWMNVLVAQELTTAHKVTTAEVPLGTMPMFQNTVPDTSEQGAPEQEI